MCHDVFQQEFQPGDIIRGVVKKGAGGESRVVVQQAICFGESGDERVSGVSAATAAAQAVMTIPCYARAVWVKGS